VLRPASRRAARQQASPYGSGSPYRPEPSGPESPYDPGSSYGSEPPGEQAPHGPGPRGQDPSYRPDPSYGQQPYRRDQFYDQEQPYGQQQPYDQQQPYRRDQFYDQEQPYDQQQPYRQQQPHGQQPPYGTGPQRPDEDRRPPRGDGPPLPGTKRRRRGRGRFRRVLKLRTVRVILVIFAVFLCWAGFSLGQALAAPNGGSMSSKLAEWARDHYLGPVVTFGEWISYSPPKVGGKPGFSLTAPGAAPVKVKAKHHGFVPNIPLKLSSPAGAPLAGEGVWRVLETVKGEPAIFGTFLRPDSTHTSYVAGIVSMDQRLVSFQLHPGAEDPGPGNWKSQPDIPPGSRTGLVATFNGGFKLNTSGGGFYLNGVTRGGLVNGTASVVYYRNGTIKIGSWGSEVRMTPDVVGVRQNLKLIVDHGVVPASVNQDVLGSWGATLGGGYYVWRSGLGITKGGRVIFVYGPALDVQSLANLLRRAGAVEGLQLDINPYWMSYEYYHAAGHPTDPTPTNLLPTQQQTAYRYYSVYSRDFTAVYSR
jgi:hypothetical protein